MTIEERKVRDFGLVFYLWILLILGAYAFGIYAFIDLAQQNQNILDWLIDQITGVGSGITLPSNIISLKYWIIGGMAGLFILGLIVAFVEIWLMSYMGAELVISTIFGIPVLLIGAGIYSFFAPFDLPWWVGLVIIAPALFLLVIVLLVARRIILGAKIFETSCEAVNENKRTLIPIALYALTSIITFVLGAGASVWAGFNLGNVLPTQNQWVQTFIFFVIIYVYLAIYWTFMYFFDAINICIFKRWNNYKDASVIIAMKEVFKVKGSIVLFGMFMAFFDWIIKIVQYFAVKKLKQDSKFYKVWSVMKKVLYVIFFLLIVVLKWLFKILKFLNYYTLTIIVVEKQGFIKSIAKSSELALDSGADIIIGKTGVNIAKGLFTALTFTIFAVGGYFVGYYWLGLKFTTDQWQVLALFGLAICIVFFFFGYLPMSALFKPLNTAYKTILFFYITDPFRGNTGRRTRLSEDIQQNLSKVRDNVMENYDKEDRPKWTNKKQEEVTT